MNLVEAGEGRFAVKTIRGRIAVFLAVCLAFIGFLTVTYYRNMLALEEKIAIVEKFDDFRESILELRRYEKNVIYYMDAESLNESIFYLFKTEDLANKLQDKIEQVVGPEKFQRFMLELQSYKRIMQENMANIKSGKGKDALETSKFREKGKALVDFAQFLIEKKRLRIHKILKKTLHIPIPFVASLVLFVLVVFEILGRGVLKPMAIVKKATENFARGDFSPIPYKAKRPDEISSLILAFNRMAKELEVRQEQLIQSRKLASIGTFTSGIAHELNNPLNNISLTAESLLEECEDLSRVEAKEMILDILNQTARAGEVVKNLLDFSRSEESAFEELEVREVVERSVKLVKNQLMLTGISLTRTVPEDLPLIKGNIRNLEQVFTNLFLNSIQAMPDGGRISIVASKDANGYVRIDFSDTGIGIAQEKLERIFDPFFTTKPVGRGTGLGLSIVYGIVKKHRGYIEVKSELNVGTTFSIFLPTAEQFDKLGGAENAESDNKKEAALGGY